MPGVFVVAMDGSGHAKRALDVAQDLAGSVRAKLVLVHVFHAPHGSLDRYRLSSRGRTSEFLDKANQMLLEHQRSLRGLKVETVLEVGDDPAEVVARVAQEKGASMIFVGPRGLGRLKRLLTGSVTDHLVQVARCSVVVAR